MDWTETQRDREGALIGVPMTMHAMIQIYVDPPSPDSKEAQKSDNAPLVGVSRRGGHGSAVASTSTCSASMTSRTRSCDTESEFDPKNWWTKWGAILGIAQSPKIQSIKGDKRNGHVAFGTFVGI